MIWYLDHSDCTIRIGIRLTRII